MTEISYKTVGTSGLYEAGSMSCSTLAMLWLNSVCIIIEMLMASMLVD